ncbi:MAG: translation initiation factor IF-2 associated domain-containing protein, partial [Luminiphilus sp.]|nr:translation initiation factor IF-2 associated domain-containing protein [Luminiphilus sp.]
MAEVTVEQLAKTVGTDPDKLLSQMKDAGLPHKKADEGVSDDDKRTLLAHLKRSHGSEEAAPRKITLKRKSVSTLKTGGSSGKRTVNVEVRKKRTYVKRPEVEESAETEVPEVVPAAETLSEPAATVETAVEVDTPE